MIIFKTYSKTELKNQKNLIFQALQVILVPILVSCSYKKTTPPGSSFFEENNSENLNLPAQSLNYEEISRNILTPKCLSCHSNSGGNRGRVNLETYANVFSLKDRIKASVISQEMPIGDSLNQEELNSLVTWIDNGALESPIETPITETPVDTPIENPGSDPVVTAPIQITFNSVNKDIFIPKCTRCHSETGGNRGGINLETYEKIVEVKDLIRSSVETRFMPIRDTLSNDQIDAVLSWIDSGALNN